ncbi:MAG: hypothetical protein IPH44_19365 [Myxococcales bacterium]|nr:hypothetical protein [Myxococcales bacterium]
MRSPPARKSPEQLRRENASSTIVLVGGQALAFWVEHYVDRFDPPGPINSKDIDFCGNWAARRESGLCRATQRYLSGA